METLATPHCEQILASCGYKEKTIYVEKSVQNQKNKEKTKEVSHGSIYHTAKTVKTNIRKYFFRLINEQFLQEHKFQKIFNKNAIKLSFSCMSNIKSPISGHSQKILQD